MEIINSENVVPRKGIPADLRQLFEAELVDRSSFSFGVVTFKPGVRIPAEGDGTHDGDEYSIVIKGEITAHSGGEDACVTAGQACFIPAGEHHWSRNDSDEDCEIVWLLINP